MSKNITQEHNLTTNQHSKCFSPCFESGKNQRREIQGSNYVPFQWHQCKTTEFFLPHCRAQPVFYQAKFWKGPLSWAIADRQGQVNPKSNVHVWKNWWQIHFFYYKLKQEGLYRLIMAIAPSLVDITFQNCRWRRSNSRRLSPIPSTKKKKVFGALMGMNYWLI